MTEPTSSQNSRSPRQRWMLYAVYAAAAAVCFSVLSLLLTLNQVRKLLGDKGIEYCWKYGSFERYLSTTLTLTCVDVCVLLSLYWLARRNHLFAYLVVWATWLLGEPLLSFFDMSYC
jgi:small neutral amino acid transporter SnatA (MarC family)